MPSLWVGLSSSELCAPYCIDLCDASLCGSPLIPVIEVSIFLFLFSQIWLLSSFPLGFPCDSAGKQSACKVGDLGSIPGLRRSSGERKGYPLRYSGLENSMDCIVHGVAKTWTQQSNFHFHISPGYSLELCIQMGISFLCSFAFSFSSFLSYL